MHGKTYLMLVAAAVGACSHSAATNAATVECTADTIAKETIGLGGEEACNLVRQHVQGSLTAVAAAQGTGVTIDLDLSRPGSAIARVRHVRVGIDHEYPVIAVDVMDRDIRRDDLVRLADAVTQAILTELRT